MHEQAPAETLAAPLTFSRSCLASSTLSRRCCCSSSSRRSTSARSSSRAAGWPSAGTRTSRPPAASTSTSATSRRSTRRPTSSSSWPRPRAAGGSPATRSRSRRPRRARRARRPAGAPTRPSSAQRAAAEDRAKHDPFGSRVPDHSVVHRYARCLSYPEWGVGTVTGIYFSGDGDDVQQWARVLVLGRRAHDPGRIAAVRRLLQARSGRRPRPALHDRGPARAGRGRRRAGRPAPRLRPRRRPDQSGRAAAAHRAPSGRPGTCPPPPGRCATGPGSRPTAPRPSGSRRGSTRTWARSTSPPRRPQRAAERAPGDASAWERLGRLRLRLMDRAGGDLGARARPADRARRSRACSTSRSPTTWPATSAPRCRRPRRHASSMPESRAAWSCLRPRARADRSRSGVHRGLPTRARARRRTRRSPICSRGSRPLRPARAVAANARPDR